jgi:hypothetical protein
MKNLQLRAAAWFASTVALTISDFKVTRKGVFSVGYARANLCSVQHMRTRLGEHKSKFIYMSEINSNSY